MYSSSACTTTIMLQYLLDIKRSTRVVNGVASRRGGDSGAAVAPLRVQNVLRLRRGMQIYTALDGDLWQ
jgi:hypothetical protein